MNNEKVYIVIGFPGHGKTTVSKSLAEATGLVRGSTSDPVYLHIAEWLSNGMPALSVATSEELLRGMSKEKIRPELVRVGDFLTKEEPEFLVRRLYESGCRIIDGVRRREQELPAVRKYFSLLGVVCQVIWVQRLPEPVRISDNTTVTWKDADRVIVNYGDGYDELRVRTQLAWWVSVNDEFLLL